MNKKGYTIMEAVIAMFLVVVMVGAVFSALMSSRRAIVSSSEKEELLYSINSAYSLAKDCRSDEACHLKQMNSGGTSCSYGFSAAAGTQNLKSCDPLFTFNFKNLCKNNGANDKFEYRLTAETGPTGPLIGNNYTQVNNPLHGFYKLSFTAKCTESSEG